MDPSKVFAENIINDSFLVERLMDASLNTTYATRLNYHRILLLEKGTGKIIVDDNKFELSGSEVFMLGKGQLYKFEESSKITGFVLAFGDCFWEKAPASASNCKALLFNNVAGNQQLTLTIDEVTELSFLSSRRLTDLCKRCSDKNAKEIINGQVLAEAKRSLQFSASPVKEIAYELNFNSPEQFSHFFKKATTYSPANYRDLFIHSSVKV